MTGVYTANADSLNTRKDVDTLLYSKSDGVYYYSCKDASAYKIDTKTDNDADYVLIETIRLYTEFQVHQ